MSPRDDTLINDRALAAFAEPKVKKSKKRSRHDAQLEPVEAEPTESKARKSKKRKTEVQAHTEKVKDIGQVNGRGDSLKSTASASEHAKGIKPSLPISKKAVASPNSGPLQSRKSRPTSPLNPLEIDSDATNEDILKALQRLRLPSATPGNHSSAHARTNASSGRKTAGSKAKIASLNPTNSQNLLANKWLKSAELKQLGTCPKQYKT